MNLVFIDIFDHIRFKIYNFFLKYKKIGFIADFFVLWLYLNYLPQPLPQPHKSKRIISVQQSIPQPLPFPQRHCKIISQSKSEQGSHPPIPKPPQPPPQLLLLKKFICSS